MEKELRDKWIKALLSGRYKQCRGGFQVGAKNCAVGVLLRVARVKRELWVREVRLGDVLGLTERVGLTTSEEYRLLMKNDNLKWGFSKIAKWIEKNL